MNKSLKTKKKNIILNACLAIATLSIGFIKQESYAQTVQNIDWTGYKQVKITRIIDGDTFAYEENGKEHQIRLFIANTPERKTQEGIEATKYTEKALLNKKIKVCKVGQSYQRDVAIVLTTGNYNYIKQIIQAKHAKVLRHSQMSTQCKVAKENCQFNCDSFLQINK